MQKETDQVFKQLAEAVQLNLNKVKGKILDLKEIVVEQSWGQKIQRVQKVYDRFQNLLQRIVKENYKQGKQVGQKIRNCVVLQGNSLCDLKDIQYHLQRYIRLQTESMDYYIREISQESEFDQFFKFSDPETQNLHFCQDFKFQCCGDVMHKRQVIKSNLKILNSLSKLHTFISKLIPSVQQLKQFLKQVIDQANLKLDSYKSMKIEVFSIKQKLWSKEQLHNKIAQCKKTVMLARSNIQQIMPLHKQLPNLIKKSSKNCIPLQRNIMTIEGKFQIFIQLENIIRALTRIIAQLKTIILPNQQDLDYYKLKIQQDPEQQKLIQLRDVPLAKILHMQSLSLRKLQPYKLFLTWNNQIMAAKRTFRSSSRFDLNYIDLKVDSRASQSHSYNSSWELKSVDDILDHDISIIQELNSSRASLKEQEDNVKVIKIDKFPKQFASTDRNYSLRSVGQRKLKFVRESLMLTHRQINKQTKRRQESDYFIKNPYNDIKKLPTVGRSQSQVKLQQLRSGSFKASQLKTIGKIRSSTPVLHKFNEGLINR